ncbi:MAG TPA: FG-GAP repeat protein, partial [Terriglobales bacterium]|nr:FG-GAP repeat protein [Terriglobales bacterium]
MAKTSVRGSHFFASWRIALRMLLPTTFLLSLAQAQSSPLMTVQFTNVAKQAGINFVHYKGNNGMAVIREEFGPGVCVADYDGDGYQDIYFVNG